MSLYRSKKEDTIISDQRYQLNNIEFLVNNADSLRPILDEDYYRFQVTRHGNRNSIEHIF
jgi:hypothetical protein